MTTSRRGSGRRSAHLDCMRGIAAAGVLIHHIILTSPTTWTAAVHSQLYYTPMEALFSGGKFVRFFFVLSGLGMYGLIVMDGRTTLWAFYVRRFVKIYIPFLVAVALSLIINAIATSQPTATSVSPWYIDEAGAVATKLSSLIAMLALVGTSDGIRLNCATWSLVYEMRMILFFPLLALCIKGYPGSTLLFIGLVSIASNDVYKFYEPNGSFATAQTVVGSTAASVHFLPFFTLGALAAQYMKQLVLFVSRQRRVVRILLFIVGLILIRRNNELHAGLGYGILIVSSECSQSFLKVTRWVVLQWLGSISFALYLVHIPCIVLTYSLLSRFLEPWSLSLVVIAMAGVAAHIFNVLVIMPTGRLAEHITSAVEKGSISLRPKVKSELEGRSRSYSSVTSAVNM